MSDSTTTEEAKEFAEPLVKEVLVEASPETVFDFFTVPEKMTRWIASEVTVDPRPGGINHQTHPGSEEHTDGPYYMKGEYVEVDRPNRVSFTWGFEGFSDDGPYSTLVEVTFEPRGDRTLVRLVHSRLSEEARKGYAGGWDEVLGMLKSAVESSA